MCSFLKFAWSTKRNENYIWFFLEFIFLAASHPPAAATLQISISRKSWPKRKLNTQTHTHRHMHGERECRIRAQTQTAHHHTSSRHTSIPFSISIIFSDNARGYSWTDPKRRADPYTNIHAHIKPIKLEFTFGSGKSSGQRKMSQKSWCERGTKKLISMRLERECSVEFNLLTCFVFIYTHTRTLIWILRRIVRHAIMCVYICVCACADVWICRTFTHRTDGVIHI